MCGSGIKPVQRDWRPTIMLTSRMPFWDGRTIWAERCFNHSLVHQLNDQRLAHFSTIDPQFECNRIAGKATRVPGAGEVPRHFMQLALFWPCRQMAIGMVYSILDQGPDFGAEDRLRSFKLGVGISDSSSRLCSPGFFLATALMSLVQCQIKLMFKGIGHRSHLHGRSTGRALNNLPDVWLHTSPAKSAFAPALVATP